MLINYDPSSEGAMEKNTSNNAPACYAGISHGMGCLQGMLSNWEIKQRIRKMREEAHKDTFDQEKFNIDRDAIIEAFKENLTYQIESVSNQFKYLREQQDFKFFCERFWLPQFEMTINSLELPLAELTANRPDEVNIQLIVAWTPALQKALSENGIDAIGNYKSFCESLKHRIGVNPVLSTGFINGWHKCSTGVVNDVMLLYHVMKGIPTIVLFFTEQFGIAAVEVASWGLTTGYNDFSLTRILEGTIPEQDKQEYVAELLYGAAAFSGDTMRRCLTGRPFHFKEMLPLQIKKQPLLRHIELNYKDFDEALNETPLILITEQ